MGRDRSPINIEEDQKFDRAIVERLAKIVADLPNLEE
jgi:hypothetical protein